MIHAQCTSVILELAFWKKCFLQPWITNGEAWGGRQGGLINGWGGGIENRKLKIESERKMGININRWGSGIEKKKIESKMGNGH